MSSPLILITTHAVDPAGMDSFQELSRDYAAFVEANEPQTMAHYAYVDAGRAEISLVHVHADAAAADAHMQAAGRRIGNGLAHSTTLRVEVYGDPGPVLTHALQANASAGALVNIKSTTWEGGFNRY